MFNVHLESSKENYRIMAYNEQKKVSTNLAYMYGRSVTQNQLLKNTKYSRKKNKK